MPGKSKVSDKPVIGITTYGRNPEEHFTLPADYVYAVRRAGGVPLLLAPGESEVERLIEFMDGVILAGGGDLDPHTYRGSPHEKVYNVDAERDAFELELASRLARGAKPILGICRGAQVLNVALGGSLHEHLPDVFGEEVLHRLPPREPTPHALRIEADSGLASLLGTTSCSAMSWHHQSIRDVAPGCRVVAHAPDGVIEAFELPEHPWLYAVQWHPELSAASDETQQGLFDAIVAAAAARIR